MCGILGVLGRPIDQQDFKSSLDTLHHRGPDDYGIYQKGDVTLGHKRLSIIDLSKDGHQPMQEDSERYTIVFNGEIYNYLELKAEIGSRWNFKSASDTEVLLASYAVWGADCLNKLIGMFAFVIWDNEEQQAFMARDRFGVKPFYYSEKDGFVFGSEIKALHAIGVDKIRNHEIWSLYLTHAIYNHDTETFWGGIQQLKPGHYATWSKESGLDQTCYYNLPEIVKSNSYGSNEQEIIDEYLSLLMNSIELRFRADVPVGINLSGGLDSSTLLGLVQKFQGPDSHVNAFTFTTGDENYDELPWVDEIIQSTKHPLIECRLNANEVPSLAQELSEIQDEPYGGLPTIAYSQIFKKAREMGVIVLLDGQGMDEQWAGYDYYLKAGESVVSTIQGTSDRPVRPNALNQEFVFGAKPLIERNHEDALIGLQLRDIQYTKIPRALRFNDRNSMMYSTELREPFLDHRLFEASLGLARELKIQDGKGKYLLRKLVSELLPSKIANAPKRPMQTPQREWLRGPLKDWATDMIQSACNSFPDWLVTKEVEKEWQNFLLEKSDNSFYVWQWISMGMLK